MEGHEKPIGRDEALSCGGYPATRMAAGAADEPAFDMALTAVASARHLGFVETGRAQPSREAVGRFADALDMPLRERNALLRAAGYAPQHHETALEKPGLERMRDAIDLILAHQNPYPRRSSSTAISTC